MDVPPSHNQHPRQTSTSASKHYTNGEITVLWQPSLCIHSAVCFKGLPEVFNPKSRPWIQANSATSEQIKAQVEKCPSKAISIIENTEVTTTSVLDSKDASVKAHPAHAITTIDIVPNGPLKVVGDVVISQANGLSERKETVFLCRCGASQKKPFCDGSHKNIVFDN